MVALPQPLVGATLWIGKAASVQFAGDRAIMLRVTSLPGWVTYDGWMWLSGYVINAQGEAEDKRNVFVQRSGLRAINPPKPKPIPRRAKRGTAPKDTVGPGILPPRPRPLVVPAAEIAKEAAEPEGPPVVVQDTLTDRKRGYASPNLI